LPALTEMEARVFAGLGGSACHIDRLAVSLNLSAAECAAVLLTLELKGVGQAIGRVICSHEKLETLAAGWWADRWDRERA